MSAILKAGQLSGRTLIARCRREIADRIRPWSSLAPHIDSLCEIEECKGPKDLYFSKVASGELRRGDEHQEAAIQVFQGLYDELDRSVTERRKLSNRQSGLSVVNSLRSEGSLWSSLFAPRQAEVEHIKGIYIFGGVGTGKTMMMDLFYESLDNSKHRKQRIHFHEFMLGIHRELKMNELEDSPLEKLAEKLASRVRILCLDELIVTDIADAVILNRLFSLLWKSGLVLVCTSNRPPDDLYKNGLQRALFVPFIENLKLTNHVIGIQSQTDYRRLQQLMKETYFVGDDASALLDAKFERDAQLFDEEIVTNSVITIASRQIMVPIATASSAKLTFKELCLEARGAADYAAIANSYRRIYVDMVPRFNSTNINAARRFITLVDVLYEHHGCIVCSAQGPVEELFSKILAPDEYNEAAHGGDPLIHVDQNVGFEKERTVSRLIEMQSDSYWSTSKEIFVDPQ